MDKKKSKSSRNEGRLQKDKMVYYKSFLGHLLKGTEQLALSLYPNDSFYHSSKYSLVQEEEAKKLVLYGLNSEVSKAAYGLVQKIETIETITDVNDPQHRLLIESINDELQLWVRKLTEVLIDAILFTENDIDLEYRIYLSLENLEQFNGKKFDMKEFQGIVSENINQSILNFRQRIDSDLTAINQSNPWFLNKNSYKKDKFPLFKSVRERYKQAINKVDAEEWVLLGITYHSSYSLSSTSIHSKAGSSSREINSKIVLTSANHILMLGLHILDRLNDLNRTKTSFSIKSYAQKGSSAPSIMDSHKKELSVDDLVTAQGRLAKVSNKCVSKYGYTSYKLIFLNDPPHQDIKEDWYPSQQIGILLRKCNVRNYISNSPLEALKSIPNIFKKDDDYLLSLIEKAFVDLEKKGVLSKVNLSKKNKNEDLSNR